MLEELLIKREYWTDDKISEFNNFVVLHKHKVPFAWEWTDSGFFYITKDLIEFTNLDTNEGFSINSNIENSDYWNLCRQFYIKAAAKSIKTELPMHRELTTVNGNTYEYIITCMHGFKIDKFQHLNFDEFLRGIVEDVYQYLLILKEIVEETGCRYPVISFSDRVKTDIGYQWKLPTPRWEKSLDRVVYFCYEQLHAIMKLAPGYVYISEDEKALIVADAEAKWGQVL